MSLVGSVLVWIGPWLDLVGLVHGWMGPCWIGPWLDGSFLDWFLVGSVLVWIGPWLDLVELVLGWMGPCWIGPRLDHFLFGLVLG